MGTFTRRLGAVGATMSKLKTRGAREVFMINRNIVGVLSFNVHPNGGWESFGEVYFNKDPGRGK